jgi:hypothetical protein
MRSATSLVFAVLMMIMALSSTLNAYAVAELLYDGGVEESYDCPSQNAWRAVRFVFADFGLSGSRKLLTARFYQSAVETAHDQVELHVLNSDGSGDWPGSTPVTFTTITGWNDISLSGQNIIVSGDFWIAYKWLGQFQAPCLALEYSAVDGRSFNGSPGSWTVDSSYDYLIRAVLDSPTGGTPVGGFVRPVNKLLVLAPYLAMFGLIGVAAVVSAKRRKNPDTD